MTEFNRENVRKALVELVAEKGEDYVYPLANTGKNCRYADKAGNPSCLVGHVVARLDPEKFEQLADWETDTGGGAWWEPAEQLGIDGNEVGLTDALAMAQEAQDSGKTWGEALKAFDHTIDRQVHDDEEAEDDE